MAAAQTALRIIDADTHLTEPVDLWTARIPERYRDDAPQVRLDERTGGWRWVNGGRWCSVVGNYSIAGWPEFPPWCTTSTEDWMRDLGAPSGAAIPGWG